MHELGVVFHIADSVVKVAEENQARRVHTVTLEIGEVSTCGIGTASGFRFWRAAS